MKELVFNRAAVHESLKADLFFKTSPVNSPEGDPELPDDGLPDELDENSKNDSNTEEEDD